MKRTLTILLILAGLPVTTFGQTPDRAPVLEPAAMALFETSPLDLPACWNQLPPPAVRLTMRGSTFLDPRADFTLTWQPPNRLCVQGQLSLDRIQTHLLKDIPLMIPGLMTEILSSSLPACVDQLKQQGSLVLNLIGFMAVGADQVGRLQEWFLRDPEGLAESGQVDVVTDPEAPGPSLIIRGIPGGTLAGESLGVYFPAYTECPDRFFGVQPGLHLDGRLVWEDRGGIRLPVRMDMTIQTADMAEPDPIRFDLEFQQDCGHWFLSRLVMDLPDGERVTVVELLSLEADPDLDGFDWEDHLEMVDEDVLEARLDREFEEQKKRYR